MKKLLILLSLIFLQLWTMEPPLIQPTTQEVKESEIPAAIKTKYDEEIGKFERYDLLHPEKFLEKIQKQFQHGKDPLQYLNYLQLFASKLLLQNMLIQEFMISNFLEAHTLQLQDEIYAIMQENKKYRREVSTDEINEILFVIQSLSEKRARTREELKTIFRLIADPKNSLFIQNTGKILQLRNEKLLTENLANAINNKAVALLALAHFPSSLPLKSFISANTSFIDQIYESYIDYFAKLKKAAQKDIGAKEITASLMAQQNKIFVLYGLLHTWYQKLYSIIRKELQNNFLQLIKKDPQNKTYIQKLKIFPRERDKDNLLPEFLPSELPLLIEPFIHTQLPSHNKELEEFRLQWQKEHPEIKTKQETITTKEIEKKKPKRHRRPQKGVPSQELVSVPLKSEFEAKEIKEQELEEIQAPPKPASIIKKASDDSYILEGEETEKNITIHDPKNKTVITLFKTNRPFSLKEKLPAKNYTDWVQMWFKNWERALQIQGYTTLNSPKFTTVSEYWRPIAIHAFPLLVDDYIMQWGTLATIPSRRDKTRQDFLITLPGAMKYPDGTQETGVFAYLIDSRNGQWYHRMFEPQSGTKLISDLFELGYFSPEMTGYYDVYFPPLGKK